MSSLRYVLSKTIYSHFSNLIEVGIRYNTKLCFVWHRAGVWFGQDGKPLPRVYTGARRHANSVMLL